MTREVRRMNKARRQKAARLWYLKQRKHRWSWGWMSAHWNPSSLTFWRHFYAHYCYPQRWKKDAVKFYWEQPYVSYSEREWARTLIKERHQKRGKKDE